MGIKRLFNDVYYNVNGLPPFHPTGYKKSNTGKPRKVLFLTKETDQCASTRMRSWQLAEICSEITETEVVHEIRRCFPDSLVIVSKNYVPEFDLEEAKKTGAVFYLDPIDSRIDSGVIDLFHGVIASSFRQYLFYRKKNKPCFLILHHVDSRLKNIHPQQTSFNCGYFGEIANAKFGDQLKDVVDFVSVKTSSSNIEEWVERLPKYSCHYLIRRIRENDGFKPATKLFIASHLGVPVIVPRWESDVEFLLRPDYPYFVEKMAVSHVRDVIAFAKESFGTSVWKKAIDDVSQISGWNIEDMRKQLAYFIENEHTDQRIK